MERKNFVETTLNDTIGTAFAWVDHIEYGTETFEHVVIVCNNGHKYRACIECDSLGAIVEDVIKECLRH